MNGQKGQPPAQVQQIREFSSGGLAGVWAEQNTREAIFDAMARKETFGTSGPMIKVRFFASWDLTADDLKRPDFIKLAYAKGVPMGGDLKPSEREGANLLRDGDEGSEERQSRSHPDRQRLDRRGRQATAIDSRRRLERRSQAGRRRQAAAGRQHRRRRARDLHEQHRRGGAVGGVDGPGLQARRTRLLLRPRARDSDATLEHDRCRAARNRHS